MQSLIRNFIKNTIESKSIISNRYQLTSFNNGTTQRFNNYSTSTVDERINVNNATATINNHKKIHKDHKSPFPSLLQPHPYLKELEKLNKSNLNKFNTDIQINSTLNNSSSDNTIKTTTENISEKDPHKIKTSVLPNGIKIISKNRFEDSSAIAISLAGGTKYESEENRGIFNLIEKMLFKSTKIQESGDIIQILSNITLNASSSSSRESLNVSIESLRKDVDLILRLLSEQIKIPLLDPIEIEQQKQVCIQHTMNSLQSHDILNEYLQIVAFGSEMPGLGSPIHAEVEYLEKLDAEQLKKAFKNYFVGKNLTISVTGIEHQDLVDIAQKYFGDLPESTEDSIDPDSSKWTDVNYIGGHLNFQTEGTDPNDFTSIRLAFPFKGLSDVTKTNDIFTGFVLQSMLGGGSDYSTGGPGKGMQSLLYQNVVFRLPEVKNCMCFFNILNHTSLFGVELASQPGYFNRSFNLLLHQFQEFFNDSVVNQEHLQRAKNHHKSLILSNLELRSVLCDDMARQMALTGASLSEEEICANIDKVTLKDVKDLLYKLLNTKASIVTLTHPKDHLFSNFNESDFKRIMKSILPSTPPQASN